MPVTEAELRAQLDRLDRELERRSKRILELDQYTGVENCPLPEAIVKARITNAYRLLMGMSNAPWGSLIVDAVTDRLIPTGIRSSQNSDSELDKLWGVWQDNHMDADCLLANDAALTHGRAFAIVWPATRGPRKGQPVVTIDGAAQVVIEYAPGSRRERIGAMRRWVDDNGRKHWTLYRPDGIYKFRETRTALSGMGGNAGMGRYERREVPGEPWPVPNPWGIVTAVELPVNCKLKPGVFPYARGEFEGSTGLLDRINTLTFLGLVVAFWMGFPLRAVIGDKIKRDVLKDDDGQPILDEQGQKQHRNRPPFQALADGVAQFENPDTKLSQFDAADRKALSIYGELDQLASVTKTPRYYLPMEGGMSNISADTVWATDGSLVSKMPKHKGSLGEGYEEILRISGMMLPDGAVDLSPRAELQWMDHEHRTMAERADAAVKLKDILPWQLIAELVLNLTQDQISRGESASTSNGLTQVVSGLLAPQPQLGVTPPPAPVPVVA